MEECFSRVIKWQLERCSQNSFSDDCANYLAHYLGMTALTGKMEEIGDGKAREAMGMEDVDVLLVVAALNCRGNEEEDDEDGIDVVDESWKVLWDRESELAVESIQLGFFH